MTLEGKVLFLIILIKFYLGSQNDKVFVWLFWSKKQSKPSIIIIIFLSSTISALKIKKLT